MSIKTITPEDVFRLNQESGGITIIDVREKDEFAEVSSPLAENHPLSTFDAGSFAKKRDKKTQLFMLCRSGKRSLKAAQLLESAGFESIYNVEGGMMTWETSGLPVVRSK
jgi:rhodanese-related sulfurtransferase